MRGLPFQLVGVALFLFIAAGCAGLSSSSRYIPPTGYTDEQIQRDMSECLRYTHARGPLLLGPSLDLARLSSGDDVGKPHDLTVHRIRGGHGGGHGSGHGRGHGRHSRHGFLWWGPTPYYWDYYYWMYERCMQDRGYKLAPGALYAPSLQDQYP